MSDHVLRNPDLVQELPHRKWLREYFPNGSEGFVVEDLDLIIRFFGMNYHQDSTGCLRLCEVKCAKHKGGLHTAQKNTFGLLDRLLRKADPRGERYQGFYLIYTENPNWFENDVFLVNGRELDITTFWEWFQNKYFIEPIHL